MVWCVCLCHPVSPYGWLWYQNSFILHLQGTHPSLVRGRPWIIWGGEKREKIVRRVAENIFDAYSLSTSPLHSGQKQPRWNEMLAWWPNMELQAILLQIFTLNFTNSWKYFDLSIITSHVSPRLHLPFWNAEILRPMGYQFRICKKGTKILADFGQNRLNHDNLQMNVSTLYP